MPTVYLISGAGRGLGLGMVKALAVTPDTVVFAGARDPSVMELAVLAAAHPDKVIPIALDSADVVLNKAAAELIEAKAGKIDIVIANAGMGKAASMSNIQVSEFIETFKVNTLGPLVLFQNTQHLLRKASATGRFVAITSTQGSIANMLPGPTGAYGVTKAALNCLTVKIQQENPDLIVFPICPGFVRTEGAQKFAKDIGAPPEALDMAVSIEVAVGGILKHIHEAVKVDQPNTFWSAMGPREVPF